MLSFNIVHIFFQKIEFIKNQINENSHDFKQLYRTTNKLLGRTKSTALPDIPIDILLHKFPNYFIEKIDTIHKQLNIKKSILPTIIQSHININNKFSHFELPSITYIYNMI